MTSRVLTKQALEAREKELLGELKYYEKRIEEAKNVKRNPCYESDSSDSELEFTVQATPSITELRRQNDMLKTCFQATQELTDVVVVQSEVNLLTEDPVFEGEPPVLESRVWKQVISECRIDLVPFSITFYVHQADRPFGPLSYRCMEVLPVKKAHKAELDKSSLATLMRPSHAIEVLRSFAVAHRSRRTTLAKLAEKYADSLFMEPKADGGYILKCANILEISWTLQNKSHIAPFHHKMKFDLEYMDESYIKIITHAHRQLSDPSVDTNERTLLLAKIINTCLEAQKPTQELHESLQSDPESLDKLRPRTLDMENMDLTDQVNNDAKIMAPPKTVPKTKIKKNNDAKSENFDPNKNVKIFENPQSLKKNPLDQNKKSVEPEKFVKKSKPTQKPLKTAEKQNRNILRDKDDKNEKQNKNILQEKSDKNVNRKEDDKQDKNGKRIPGQKETNSEKTVKTSTNRLSYSKFKKMISTNNVRKLSENPSKKVTDNNNPKSSNDKTKKSALPVPLLKHKFAPNSEKPKPDNKVVSTKRLSSSKIPEPLAKKKSLPVPVNRKQILNKVQNKLPANKVQKMSNQEISKNVAKLGLQAQRVKK